MPSPINIECEIRTFVTDEQYDRLLENLKRTAMYGGEDEQLTFYFEGNGDPDLRIQRNGLGSKIWYKGGKLHDEARHEVEIECKREDFTKLGELLTALGYRISIKWLRKRHLFKLGDVTVTLDDTVGYGKILELEKVCLEDHRDQALVEIKSKLGELGLQMTPKEEFDKRYAYYKEHWRELTKES